MYSASRVKLLDIMKNKGLIVHWNANGLKSKLGELKHSLAEQEVDITLITEIKFVNTSKGAIEIQINKERAIIAAYLRPQYLLKKEYLDLLFKCSSEVIIMGDLNAKHQQWNCDIANVSGNMLLNYMSRKNCPNT